MIFGLKDHSSRLALKCDDGNHMSYGELVQEIENFCGHVCGEKSVVLCLCGSNIETVIGYLALLNIRMVPLLLSNESSRDTVDEYVENFKPRYIWMAEDFSYQSPQFSKVFSYGGYKLVKNSEDIDYKINENLALLVTTSGSTGSQKLVRQSYDNIFDNTNAIIASLDLKSSDTTILTLPLNYTFGLSILNTHLSVGSCITITKFSIMQKEFWKLLRENAITSIYGVPFTFEALKRLKIHKQDLPALSRFSQAGGKMSGQLLEYFYDFCRAENKRFFVMYGQAEATTRISCVNIVKENKKLATVGRPLEGGTIEILPLDNRISQESRQDGEIIYKGPNVSLGYAFNRFDLADSDEFYGTLRTGDIGYCDEDGFLVITGRLKRFAKIHGHSISLDDLEYKLTRLLEYNIACISQNGELVIYSTNSHFKPIIELLEQRFRTLNGKIDYASLSSFLLNI